MTRRFLSLILVLLLATATACTGSLFKVKPATELPPLPPNTRSTEAGPVTLRFAPLLEDEALAAAVVVVLVVVPLARVPRLMIGVLLR